MAHCLVSGGYVRFLRPQLGLQGDRVVLFKFMRRGDSAKILTLGKTQSRGLNSFTFP
ncbi:hypothetical protein PO909_012492 [Leuciscus waleckii]